MSMRLISFTLLLLLLVVLCSGNHFCSMFGRLSMISKLFLAFIDSLAYLTLEDGRFLHLAATRLISRTGSLRGDNIIFSLLALLVHHFGLLVLIVSLVLISGCLLLFFR